MQSRYVQWLTGVADIVGATTGGAEEVRNVAALCVLAQLRWQDSRYIYAEIYAQVYCQLFEASHPEDGASRSSLSAGCVKSSCGAAAVPADRRAIFILTTRPSLPCRHRLASVSLGRVRVQFHTVIGSLWLNGSYDAIRIAPSSGYEAQGLQIAIGKRLEFPISRATLIEKTHRWQEHQAESPVI
jgi:hypothetical protein